MGALNIITLSIVILLNRAVQKRYWTFTAFK